MNPSQPPPGLNMASCEFPPYSHTQPFLHQIVEEPQGQKRLISPESQHLSQYQVDKRLRHNSLEYVLDLHPQQTQTTLIRKITLEDIMNGIDSLAANTVKREDLKDLATKTDLINLESNVKAQSLELHQLRTAFNRQQGEINALKGTVDSNCAAILSANERSAVREENLGHRMFMYNGGRGTQSAPQPNSKRFNLVIEGIPDLPIDEIYSFVIALAGDLKITLYKRDISNISRIQRRPTPDVEHPKPGPVVVNFVHAHLRDRILRKKIDLKDMAKYQEIYVNPDEPLEVRRQKARFRRIAYLARQDGLSVSYRADSIRIGDKEYKIPEMSSIPEKYIPKDDPLSTTTRQPDAMDTAPVLDQPPQKPDSAEPQRKENTQDESAQRTPPPGPLDQTTAGRTELRGGRICFSGATSFLSNFFLICFVYCNIKYKSLEQCYHHTHAIMAKAFDLAKEIYKETDGVELKNLSKRIPYCAEWAVVCDTKMDEMIEAKYSQNPELLDRLIRTAPYELVEASVDKKWGGGEPWASPKYDTGTFGGENRFGVKITGYRDAKIALLNAPDKP